MKWAVCCNYECGEVWPEDACVRHKHEGVLLCPECHEVAEPFEDNSPSRIYLQWHGDCTSQELVSNPNPAVNPYRNDVTWCEDAQFEFDIEYEQVTPIHRLVREILEAGMDQMALECHLGSILDQHLCATLNTEEIEDAGL